MIYYAKSVPIETISQHTDELLLRLEEYKRVNYESLPLLNQRDWELLEIAVRYHDVGKTDLVFQNKIRSVINEELLKTNYDSDVPHSFLSVMAIPYDLLKIDKEERKILSQIIGFHHERDVAVEHEQDEIIDTYKRNILPFKDEIEKQLGTVIDKSSYGTKLNVLHTKKRLTPSDDGYLKYVLLKGILHRLDHAASAHVPIELASEMNVGHYVNRYFTDKIKVEKRPLQRFVEEQQESHLVIVAQTGMGKTEAGLLWIGDKKGFLTLPLRVSINSMYSRITNMENIGFSKVGEDGIEEATGLLHSTSYEYLSTLEILDERLLSQMHNQSKEFANKLIISTIDQILKFPFYYLGFEKEYATMSTSKVIIDELQAYDPKIAALLIRAMVLIDQIGGSFMIMTATLPDYYFKTLLKKMKNPRRPIMFQEFIDDTVRRHHLKLSNQSIADDEVIQEMYEKGISKKVLVICNTVNRAVEIFDKLKHLGAKVRLLHSRFIKRDRERLEKEILEFAHNNETGIWVTTQLVEASLDIDFDILFTEMSTLDSQFQRYGRCNRKGIKSFEEANVYVFTNNVSGIMNKKGSVYHYEIYQRSLEILNIYIDEIPLLESTKANMIKELYDENGLEGTKFKDEFDRTLAQFEDRPHYDLKKQEAQNLLRDIQQTQVLPIQFLMNEEYTDALYLYESSQTKLDRKKYRKVLESFTLSVNKWRAKDKITSEINGLQGIFVIDCMYSHEKGLLLEEVELFV
ncbi:hypothetical protein BHU72_06725 [Desulfuribacillus stibiiarsenatis]|uniref:CRISPR-associated helicase/endonuclease Cas3 n=1 Tax=Desulfuribacillus stibiiarsenatis TaxID=1390249 RepID=A0A1E5L4B2_9FIRM|nr:CRISPR-associated helicase/endonuclease Cas3 [Desulfuribacillus stibiiarsenatis]OEH84883.1 hypothetical protein BHU72_06725 [Desulfuribacillus stibiiarsenatis]